MVTGGKKREKGLRVSSPLAACMSMSRIEDQGNGKHCNTTCNVESECQKSYM